MNRSLESGSPEYRIDFDPMTHVKSDTEGLESYAFKDRQPVVLDLMNVLAAVEYADRSSRRSSACWGRVLHLSVPVFEHSTWQREDVQDSLLSAISFLTGDKWHLEFHQREDAPESLPQTFLALSQEVQYVMPFSDGLDSRAVAAIFEADSPGALQLVRVGSVGSEDRQRGRQRLPFTRVPYRLNIPDRAHAEPSGRSRGFKFAVVAGVASYLGEVPAIVVPESGQGMLGPSLTTYMHAYPDYRNSPRYFSMVEDFLEKLLGRRSRFTYPRLWSTKSETIRLAMERMPNISLTDTRSCWMKQNMASLNGKYLQCGVCAACLLRRMSFHSAGVVECAGKYICDDLSAGDLEDIIPASYTRRQSLSEYAVAGASQMLDFALLSANLGSLEIESELLAPVLGMQARDVLDNLRGLISRHGREWNSFLESFGSNSYLRDYCPGGM